MHKKLGKDTAETADSCWPKGYPTPYGPCSACKDGAWRKKGGTFEMMMFVLPSNPHVRWSPAFLGVAEHLPTHQQW